MPSRHKLYMQIRALFGERRCDLPFRDVVKNASYFRAAS